MAILGDVKDSVPFVEDILPPLCLFALTIRSPVAAGRVRAVECPRLPGPYTLIRGEDIPGKNGIDGFPAPALASSQVSYIGEPVALLVGPEEARLEEYAAQCEVLVEEEPPVFSGESGEGRILAERRISIGGGEDPFKDAKTIVRGVYSTGIQEQGYAEPAGAVAVPPPEREGGPFVVHTATQWPFHVRRSVAALLGLPQEEVEVIPSALGIHLDGKVWYPSLVSCHAALAAFLTKKPVKLLLTREEDFRFGPKGNAAEIRIASALGGGGELLGTEIRVAVDLGARGFFADEILDRTCLGALGVYRPGRVRLEAFAPQTNIPPQGPPAGFGLSQGFFAMERHVSHITDTLRLNPAEWRKKNFLRQKESLGIGAPVRENAALGQLLDTVAAASGYYRKWAAYELLRVRRRGKKPVYRDEGFRGIGVALAYQGGGFLYESSDRGAYTMELTLDKDGSLEIRSSIVSSGLEYRDLWRNIAVEILAVDPALVRIRSGSTGEAADSGPSTLSRNIAVITRLLERCCRAVRKQRFRDPLPITVRRAVRPDRAPAWGEPAVLEGAVFEGPAAGSPGRLFDRNAFSRMSWGAAVVEVEIDRVSYTPRVRGIWLGIDGGRLLSEERARRALKTSAAQALDWASREAPRYIRGAIPPGPVNHGVLPAPAEIPPIHIDFVQNDAAGFRGLGELPSGCVPGAYVQAVSQAMDHHFEKIPLTARDLWEAEKLKKTEGGP